MLVSICAVLGTLAAANAADENPFKKSNVGESAEYKVSGIASGSPFESTVKYAVGAKDDNWVTLKRTAIFGKNEFPLVPDIKIDLTKPYNPVDTSGLPMDPNSSAKIEKDGDAAKEKIKLAGKEYDCIVTKYKMSGTVGGKEGESELKIWTAKDAPLSGTVKMEVKSKQGEFTMELSGK
jgi:hypothetical protein